MLITKLKILLELNRQAGIGKTALKRGGRFLDTKLKQNKREFKTIQQYSGGKGDLDSTGAHRK